MTEVPSSPPPCSWTTTIYAPDALRSSLLNYLNFFRNYARAVSGVSVIMDYSGEQESDTHKLSLVFKTPVAHDKPRVERLLQEYMGRIFADAPPVLQTELSRYEADLFLVLYKRALADIRTDLRFNFSLLTEAEKKTLAEALATLSLTDEGTEGQKSLENRQEQMLKRIDALTLPSEPQEIPASLQSRPPGQALS